MSADIKNNMQDILADIRDVISGNDKPISDEVLELTDIVEEPKKEQSKNVLNDIEAILNKDGQSNQTASAQESPAAQPEPIPTSNGPSVQPEDQPSPQVQEAAPMPPISSSAPESPSSVTSPQQEASISPESSEENRSTTTKNLLNDQVIEESSKHFKELLKAVARPHDNFGLRSGVTVEDLVVEALKPQLSAWLEKNLSAIVKELVEKEIRRLIPNSEK